MAANQFSRWIKRLFGIKAVPARARGGERRPRQARRGKLLLEHLESRELLSASPFVESFVGTTGVPDPISQGDMLTNASSVSFILTFSEPVTGVDATDFGLNGATTTSIQVTPIAASNGAAYTVTTNGLEGAFQVNLINTGVILDLSGNALSDPNGEILSPLYIVDQIPPVVNSMAGPASQLISTNSLSYEITFSEPVTGVDPTDFLLTETGTIATTSIQATAVDPNNPDNNNWIVTISGITGDGTLALKLADNNHITDLAGNPLSTSNAPLYPIFLGQGQNLMAVADINGDGKSDLIIANNLTNSMSAMLGNGDGTFQNPQPFAIGQAPFNGVVADVNGDGKPDLVILNAVPGNVTVLLNKGDGTFDAPQTYGFGGDGGYTGAVAVADMNGDGKPDLVVAGGYESGGFLSVLLNNGDGTFQAPQTLIAASRGNAGSPVDAASSLAVADLNGDGKPDLVIGAGYDYFYGGTTGRVIILFNDGNGGFVKSPSFAFNNSSSAVAVTDLNGDGKPDIVVGGDRTGLTALLNDGNGTLSNAVTLPYVLGSTLPFAADLAGDGKIDDLVVGNAAANTVSVFLNMAPVPNVPPVYTFETAVPPNAAIAVQGTGVGTGGQLSVSVAASDPSPSAQQAGFTYAINWGDGTSGSPDVQTIAATANNGAGVPALHGYAVAGIYPVTVTATDQNGTVSAAVSAVAVAGTAGADSLGVSGGANPGDVQVTLNGASQSFHQPAFVLAAGQGGGDAYTVNFGSNLTTPVILAGGGDASGDTLVVNGDNSATNVITKTPGQVTWGSPVTETVSRSGILNTVINANGTSQNTITDPGGSTAINGGPGANTITITATTGSGVVIHGGASSNTYIMDLGSLAGPVTIQNNNSAATNNLVVNGAAGNNTIAASGNQVTSGAQTITDTASLTNLTVNGGSGNNQVTVSSFSVPVQNLALNGGGGSNTFTLNNVGSTVGALAITGGSGGPGSTQVQVQGSLPAQVTVPANTAPVVNLGTGAAVNVFSAFTRSAAFVATGSAFTATVDYGDGSGVTALALRADKSFSLSHIYAAVGSYTVTVRVVDGQGDVGTGTMTVAVTLVANSTYVVNAQATSGAITISGNASIKLPGTLVVDSTSPSAILASGNAKITAAGGVQVMGGVSKSGNASVTKTGTPGATGDPLANLMPPAIPTGIVYNTAIAENLSGNSTATISQGLYSQITVSGNAKLTLNSGTYVVGTGGVNVSGNATLSGSGITYIIKGGGFTVSGNAGISGSNVLIVSGGSNYPNAAISGETYGGVTLSGNGSFSLNAATTGTYAGILIYQARDNTRALSISGNSMAGMTGTIYAANALLTMSGNASLQNPLVVGTLNLSGNVAVTQLAQGADGAGDAGGIADTLLAGNLDFYINDPSDAFTPDELARIDDAVNGWDALLAPYNVTITQVSDASLANLIVDTGTTSASGSTSGGVLGCYNGAAGEITILQGWNWYAGANPAQIGQDQYDFQTTVTHEFGHALGLGHSPDPNSPMFESLAPGQVRRVMSVADLNIPDPPTGADPLMAALPVAKLVAESGLRNGGVSAFVVPPSFVVMPWVGSGVSEYVSPSYVPNAPNSQRLSDFGSVVSALGQDAKPVVKVNTLSIPVERVQGLNDFRSVMPDFMPSLDGVETIPSTIAGDAVFEGLGSQSELVIPEQPWADQPSQTDHSAAVDEVFAQMATDVDDFSDF